MKINYELNPHRPFRKGDKCEIDIERVKTKLDMDHLASLLNKIPPFEIINNPYIPDPSSGKIYAYMWDNYQSLHFKEDFGISSYFFKHYI